MYDHAPDYSDHDGEDYDDEDYEYDHYDYVNYYEEQHTATDPEDLPTGGEQDLDLPQSQESSENNHDNEEEYNAGGDDCHGKANNHMLKPHEMVAFMCYRKISDRNWGFFQFFVQILFR